MKISSKRSSTILQIRTIRIGCWRTTEAKKDGSRRELGLLFRPKTLAPFRAKIKEKEEKDKGKKGYSINFKCSQTDFEKSTESRALQRATCRAPEPPRYFFFYFFLEVERGGVFPSSVRVTRLLKRDCKPLRPFCYHANPPSPTPSPFPASAPSPSPTPRRLRSPSGPLLPTE